MENMNEMQDNQREAVLLSYLAGIIDGEGTIRIGKNMPVNPKLKYKNPKYSAHIGLGMVDDRIPLLFEKTFGAKVRIERVTRKNTRNVYRWGTSGRIGVRNILEKLYPYLILKKEQARLVMEFCDKCEAPKARSKGVSSEQLQMREDYYQRVRELNAVGAPATTNREDT